MKVSKNSRVLFAWRLPMIHFAVLFCLYQQAKGLEKKYAKKDPSEVPSYVRMIRSAKAWKQAYWERMCDLRYKDEGQDGDKRE